MPALGVMNQHSSEFCTPFVWLSIEETKCVYLLEPVLWEGSQPVEEWLEIERKAVPFPVCRE